jgi:hypothetical protein
MQASHCPRGSVHYENTRSTQKDDTTWNPSAAAWLVAAQRKRSFKVADCDLEFEITICDFKFSHLDGHRPPLQKDFPIPP